jgi:hypothetical protein
MGNMHGRFERYMPGFIIFDGMGGVCCKKCKRGFLILVLDKVGIYPAGHVNLLPL